MSITGLHLTQIGTGDFLLEPSKGLNIRDQDNLLDQISQQLQIKKAQVLYYDLSDFALIDPVYYQWLNVLARLLQVINVEMVCVNMQATAAFGLASYLQTPPSFHSALTIQAWQARHHRN